MKQKRAARKRFLRSMSRAASQNTRHGSRIKDTSTSLETTCRPEKMLGTNVTWKIKKEMATPL
jgi:hypothetical protein